MLNVHTKQGGVNRRGSVAKTGCARGSVAKTAVHNGTMMAKILARQLPQDRSKQGVKAQDKQFLSALSGAKCQGMGNAVLDRYDDAWYLLQTPPGLLTCHQ